MTMTDFRLDTRQRGDDGSIKYIWQLDNGPKVESVAFHLPERSLRWHATSGEGGHARRSRDRSPAQHVVCVSSQAGCNVRCSFCATGLQPVIRNLSAKEIVAQVDTVLDDYPEESALGVTFAGMGEPLLSYTAVSAAIRRLLRKSRVEHVSVSTSGIVPGIYKLAEEPVEVRLWVSLHATENSLREKLIPHTRRYPIEELLVAARHYAAVKGLRVGISYLLLPGYNDSQADVGRLAALLDDGPFNVQVLLWNDIPGMSFERVPVEKAHAFAEAVRRAGYPTHVMASAAQSVQAGCGQLVADAQREPRPVELQRRAGRPSGAATG